MEGVWGKGLQESQQEEVQYAPGATQTLALGQETVFATRLTISSESLVLPGCSLCPGS